MKTTINTMGCCVARDTFGMFRGDGGFDIRKSVTNAGILSICSPKVTEESVCTEEDFPLSRNYVKRCAVLDANKQVIDYLCEEQADYTVVDLGVLYAPFTLKVRRKGETDPDAFTYLTNMAAFRQNPDYLDNAPFEVLEKFRFPENKELFFDYIVHYAAMLRERIGAEKLIIIESYPMPRYLDKDGTLKMFTPAYKMDPHDILCIDIPAVNVWLKEAYKRLEEALPEAHVIKFPDAEVPSNINHKWGLNPLHYVQECYTYFLESVKVIACGLDRDIEQQMLQRLHQVYSELLRTRYSMPADGVYDLQNLAAISSETVRCGQPLVIALHAKGGTEKYTYHVYAKHQNDTQWKEIGVKHGGSIPYSPDYPGLYRICVKMQDTNHIMRKKYFTFAVR